MEAQQVSSGDGGACPTWPFYLGVGVECAVDLAALLEGIFAADAHNLIGGAAVRLVAVLAMGHFTRRGSQVARGILLALEGLTSAGGIGAAVIFATTGSGGHLKGLAGGLAIAMVYGAITVGIYKGSRRDTGTASRDA